jgi:hypothetical protein
MNMLSSCVRAAPAPRRAASLGAAARPAAARPARRMVCNAAALEVPAEFTKARAKAERGVGARRWRCRGAGSWRQRGARLSMPNHPSVVVHFFMTQPTRG